MALGDPFSSVLDVVSRRRQQQQQQNQEALSNFSNVLLQQEQQKRSMDMLKQMGIMTEESATTADQVKAYEDVANKTIKNTYGELKTQGNVATDEQKLQLLNTLFDKFGLPKPKVPGKGLKLNYDRAAEAGLTLNPMTGEMQIKPTTLLPSTDIQAMEIAKYKAGQEAGIYPKDTDLTFDARGHQIIKPKSAALVKLAEIPIKATKILDAIQNNPKSVIPELVLGFGNPDLRAELQSQAADKKINLQDFYLNWKAQEKIVSSLNGPQQSRLQQVISYANQSIPQMRKLSETFKRFDWTPANAVELQAASTSTLVDPELRDAATKFLVQYNTMRTDLAQVFSGGYAVQKEHLAAADETLNKLWGQGQMSAGLDQLEIDLGFKGEALKQVGITMPAGMLGKTLTDTAGITGGLKIGDIKKGYKYKGGNPADKNNWEKQ